MDSSFPQENLPVPQVPTGSDDVTAAATVPGPEASAQGNETEQPVASTPEFNVDDYLRLKQELETANSQLQEKNSLVQQIQQMAEQQKAVQAQAQLRSEIQQDIANLLRRAGVEDDDLLEALTGTAYGRIDQTRTTYEQQMQDYYQRVTTDAQDMVWAAHKNGFANHLIGEYKLDPAFLPHLQQAKNEGEMLSTAAALREATQLYRTRTHTETVQAQEQARRASGVDTITGTNSGPTVAPDLPPGKNLDVLAQLFSAMR